MTLRKPPLDLVALAAIALAMLIVELPFLRHGMCFNDPSWMFHFGRRALHGEVPYRDFVFQVGPLPVYVDAAFQREFGSTYLASQYAGLLIKILRVFVMWMLVRRLVDTRVAVLVVVFYALDGSVAFAHHWSTEYSLLFFTLAGLFCVIAMRTTGRRELAYLALAGLAAGLIVSARQSAAIMCGLLLLASTAILLVRRDYFTWRRFAALWTGFLAAYVIVFGALALAWALGPAIQQMFFDAAQKKGVHGIDALLDPLTGGAATHDGYRLAGFLHFILLPLCGVAGAVLLSARRTVLRPAAIAAAIMPIAIVAGLATRHAELFLTTDVPRTFLTALAALAVLAPVRSRGWFGLEPLHALVLGGLPLASDWSLELSFPGRGWGDPWALVTGVLLVALASTRLSRRVKTGLAAGFAIVGVLHVAQYLGRDINPFAKDGANDGTLTETSVAVPHPLLAGMLLPAWRARALAWLEAEVPPGSTCFIYAEMPVLYDLLDCHNPTALDATITDYFTADDAAAAIAILRATPPDVLLAHEKTWLSPPLSLDLGGRADHYESWNPYAAMTLHVGLRSILDRYEDLGSVADVIGPDATKAAHLWDQLDGLRVYRRRR